MATVARRTSFSRSFTLLWFLSVVNCAFLQLQMVLFTGAIRIPGYTIKLLLVFPLVASWFFNPQNRMRGGIRTLWILSIVCLTLSFIVVLGSGHLNAGDQTSYFLTNYLFLLLAPVCLLATPHIDLRRLSKILVIVAFPLMVLGIAQHLLSDPILPTASEDGNLYITSWDFFRVRAFSLFGSGLDFSCFLALVAPFFLVCALVKRQGYPGRLVSVIGFSLCLVATYATLTRAAYLVVLQSAIVGWSLARGRAVGKAIWAVYPLIGTVVAILAIIVVPLVVGIASHDILDNQSLLDRLISWNTALQDWTTNGATTFLFGTGESQGAANIAHVVDNDFLNFAVQSGLIGLLSCTGLMWALWMSLRQIVVRSPSPLRIAMCAFWSTWILSGTFNWTNTVYAVMLMPLLASEEFDETNPGSERYPKVSLLPSLPSLRPADV